MKRLVISFTCILIMMSPTIAHVELLNPTGGESYMPGSQVSIEWQEVLRHEPLNWDIYFSSDGGETWNPVESDISIDTYSYYWTVPDNPTSEGRIKIVQDNVDADYEDVSDDFVVSSITGIEASPESMDISIYPNPIRDISTIEFNNPDKNNFTLTIYDTNGHLVRSKSDIKTDRILLDRQNLRSGLFFFQLISNKQKSYRGKIIIL